MPQSYTCTFTVLSYDPTLYYQLHYITCSGNRICTVGSDDDTVCDLFLSSSKCKSYTFTLIKILCFYGSLAAVKCESDLYIQLNSKEQENWLLFLFSIASRTGFSGRTRREIQGLVFENFTSLIGCFQEVFLSKSYLYRS